MKEKKNIERLFQESFKDFEETPREKNWDAIQNRLHKEEKDQKAIPVWFRYAGVAAILLLFFVLGGKSFFNSKNGSSENKVSLETGSDIPREGTATKVPNNKVANTGTQDPKDNTSKDSPEQDSHATDTDRPSSENANPNTFFAPQNQNVDNRSVASIKSNSLPTEGGSKIKDEPSGQSSKSIVKNAENRKASKPLPVHISDQNHSTPIIQDTQEKGQVALNSNPASSEMPPTIGPTQPTNPTDNSVPLEKNTLIEADIAGTNAPNKAVGKEETIGLSEVQKDSLTIDEALAKAEDKDIDDEEKSANRWQLYANIAPVYYNTLGNGSHFHEQFVNNPKNGEFNTSYGINVGYALNDKFTIRAGVRSLDLSYSTENIILYESPGNGSVQSMLRNVSMSNDSNSHMVVLSSENLLVRDDSSANLFTGFNGALTQNISYYEVPVEIEYNVINKKVGFQVIGGLSTFFLDNNEVYANTQASKNYLGKANNINPVSFSANFGLGLDYNFSKKIKFNLEPTFKYQLNAYSEVSGNFRPYIIGVYTGFSYKF